MAPAHRLVTAFLLAAAFATAVSWSPARAAILQHAQTYLNIPTYDGFNQVVEPDLVYAPAGLYGHKYWMAMTPYPCGDGTHENPSIVYSDDNATWTPASTSSNPIDPGPGNGDPTIVYDGQKLIVYWAYDDGTASYVKHATSTDGTTWDTTAAVLFSETDNPGVTTLVSPSVIYSNGTYYMWYVQGWCNATAYHAQLRTSTDGIHWSTTPTAVTINNAQGTVWHFNVKQDGNTFVMVYASFTTTCGATTLYYAYSQDGVTFTSLTQPLLDINPNEAWDDAEVYRATFVSENGHLRLWYSARATRDATFPCDHYPGDGQWHVGYTDGCVPNWNGLTVTAPNAATFQTVPTYDGSNEPTNPALVYAPCGWNGYTYWMAMTPFPGGNQSLENPSIVASNDGSSWVVPAGLTNPLAANPGGGGYNNDPELLLVGSTMMLYYQVTMPSAADTIKLRTSTNGTTWTTAQTVLTLPNYVMSPAFVYDNGTYYMWYVTSPLGCPSTTQSVSLRTSSDGVNWGAATAVTIACPTVLPFEFEIHKSGALFQMVYAGYPSGSSCGFTSLYYAESVDGITWGGTPTPILQPSTCGWDNAEIYKTAFLTQGNLVRLWYSGRHLRSSNCSNDPYASDQWQIGYTEACLLGGNCSAPAAVILSASAGCYDHVFLNWIAPGANGNTGTASAYDLRWSSSPITDATFCYATSIPTSPPQPSGSAEALTVYVPRCSATRYYALKSENSAGNWSLLSNSSQAKPACPNYPIICDDGSSARPARSDEGGNLPLAVELSMPEPNPAGPDGVHMRFGIPARQLGQDFEIAVFDLVGRRVAVLEQGRAVPGYHDVAWTLRSEQGGAVHHGVYFVRFRVGATLINRRVIVLR